MATTLGNLLKHHDLYSIDQFNPFMPSISSFYVIPGIDAGTGVGFFSEPLKYTCGNCQKYTFNKVGTIELKETVIHFIQCTGCRSMFILPTTNWLFVEVPKDDPLQT